jgi:hypothetical protein
MEEEIGKIAGVIWQALSTQGELSLTRLKNQVKAKASIFDWAIGCRLVGIPLRSTGSPLTKSIAPRG